MIDCPAVIKWNTVNITKHIKCTNKMQATQDHEKQRNSPYSILPPTPHPPTLLVVY